MNIIHGDCLEVMRGFADNQFDLVLTDPPYGIGIARLGTVRGCKDLSKSGALKGFKKEKDYGNQDWDSGIPSKEVFEQIFRVSKNQIIFGGNYFTEYLPNSSCWLVWDKKENAVNDFSDCELAYTSFKKAVRKFTYGFTGFEGINNLRRDGEIKEHPTQKPLALMQWCLQKYSKRGDTILDPFMGSGTTLLAAKALGIDATGIEINEQYCEIARRRLEQTSLFA